MCDGAAQVDDYSSTLLADSWRERVAADLLGDGQRAIRSGRKSRLYHNFGSPFDAVPK